MDRSENERRVWSGISGMLQSIAGVCLLMLAWMPGIGHAQSDQVTANAFINGRVLGSDGTIFVMIPPSRIGFDPFLSFYDKSFFTAKIGGKYYTNNNVISPVPANTTKLGPPNQLFTVHGPVDTVRCIWTKRNGVDIIQDCWPVKFTKSGQLLVRWSFKNVDSATDVPVQCQWLLDMDISDPAKTANDGPIILHRYGYKDQWQQFPDSDHTPIPPFYIGFLYPLPGPGSNPGLAGMGYLDNADIGTTKPARLTYGDWYTLAQSIFGQPANINTLLGKKPGNDCALLIEFSPIAVAKKSTAVGGVTSYGTGEYEKCAGNLFSLAFYPHRLDWDRATLRFKPSLATIEMYAVNPAQFKFINGVQLTLNVCDHLSIWDSLGTISYGKTQTKPAPPGFTIPANDLVIVDFFVKPDPVYYCTGDYQACLKFSGVSSEGPPTYSGPLGDTCEQYIALGCAETDTLPPLHDAFTSTEFGKNDSIVVHDDRTIDKGLKSITWTLSSGGPASNFAVTSLDSILPCFTDKNRHRIVIHQLDSTVGGCFRFTFTDCLGNASDTEVCFPKHDLVIKDTLPPTYTVTSSADSLTLTVNVGELHSNDQGIDTITWTFPSPSAAANVIVTASLPTKLCGRAAQFTVHQKVPELGDAVYFQFKDCAGNVSYDTLRIPAPSLGVSSSQVLHELAITAIRPNPFAGQVEFEYALPSGGPVMLALYDLLGKPVATLASDEEAVGVHTRRFDGSALAEGTYIARLTCGGAVKSASVQIVRR